MKTIYHIIVKEFIQFRRDKRMMALSFMAPILQLILLGYAATTDVKDVPMAVYNQDKSVASRELIDQFVHSGYFVIQKDVNSLEEIDHEIEFGNVWMALVIPPDFSSNLLARKTASIQILTDGSDANSANISLGYASQIIATYSTSIVVDIQKHIPQVTRPARLQPEIRVWYNPDLKSRNFMVPGVLATVLMIITMTLTSLGIVKEKEIGTLEQLMVTPIKPYQLIIGKLMPFAIIGMIDVVLVLFVTRFWFGVPLQGSVVLLFGLSGLFILTTLGLGLFISTISKTQQQAMMTAQFFIFLPFIYLSGFTFPVENMPQAIQYLTAIIPLKYFIVIIRGIFLKGTGIAELWPQALALWIFGIIILTLSVLRFKTKLS
ncbi:MAG: ABC transporter permease [Ignavibacteriales bacterium]|nr:ABC transporter permease [Ignavibacteriales bacterium]